MIIWIRRIAGQSDEDWSDAEIPDWRNVIFEALLCFRSDNQMYKLRKKHLYKSTNTHEEE